MFQDNSIFNTKDECAKSFNSDYIITRDKEVLQILLCLFCYQQNLLLNRKVFELSLNLL